MLEIKTKLSMAFHLQTGEQTKQMNQKLEQYLQIFIDHQQQLWPEQLEIAEFVYNIKVYTATKILSFKANYRIDPKMGSKLRKRERSEKINKFVKKLKETQTETKATLNKV